MTRFRRTRALAIADLAASLVAGACGGPDKESTGANATTAKNGATQAATTAQTPDFSPVVAMSEPLVGKNRFALGILDGRTGAPLPDAKVKFRFFELQGNQGTFRFDADATFRAPARDAGLATAV